MQKSLCPMDGDKPPPTQKFFIPCILPKTTHQAGNTILKTKDGRYFVGKSKKGKGMSQTLQALLRIHKPPQAYTQPLSVEIAYYFPYNKTATKAHKAIDPLPKATRADCDNLAKGVLDAMQAIGFMNDDAQVYSLKITKAYSKEHGLGIIIKPWTHERY